MSQLGQVREFCMADLPEVGRFMARQIALSLGQGPPSETLEKGFAWLYFENPQQREAPRGWVYRDAVGMVQGFHGQTAHDFAHPEAPGETVRVFVSSNFYVDESARGLPGALLFQPFLTGAKHGVIAATTANASSGAFFRKVGAVVPSDYTGEWIQMVRLPRLVEEALLRRRVPAWFAAGARLIPWLPRHVGAPHGLTGKKITMAEVEAMVGEMGSQRRVPGEMVRDLSFLQWRYFGAGSEHTDLVELRAEGNVIGFLAVHRLRRGKRMQIRCAHLIDLAVPASFREKALQYFIKMYRPAADLLFLRGGLGLEPENLQHNHFRFRALEAPPAWMWSRSTAEVVPCLKMTAAAGDAAVG